MQPLPARPRDASRLARRAGAGRRADRGAARAQPGVAAAPTLGWVYLTDHYAPQAAGAARRAAPALAGRRLGRRAAASASRPSGVEYFDEPALALMLADLPREHVPRVLRRAAAAPLRRRTPRRCTPTRRTADLAELIHDMSAPHRHRLPVRRPRVGARRRRLHIADGVLARRPVRRGVRPQRGAGLARHAGLPAGRAAAHGHARPSATWSPRSTASRRSTACCATWARRASSRATRCRSCAQTLVGLSDPADALADGLGERATRRVRRRHAGAPPDRPRPGARRGIAIADIAEPGMQLAFCSAQRRGGAARPGAHLHRDPRRGRARGAAAADRAGAEDAGRASRRRPRPASPARSTSAAPGAAARTSARRRPSWRSCATRSATCRWSASSPPARSRAATCTATPAC